MPSIDPPLPDANLDLRDAALVIDLFQRATDVNFTSSLREGSTIRLPAKGTLVMTGDLHDHTINYRRLVKMAALHQSPDHHLVLHELLHGPHMVDGRDLSIRLLARAAALQLAYPQQVHMLLANHDLAQAIGSDILKNSHSVVKAFNAGLDYIYGEDAPQVAQAASQYILSFALAIRAPNGFFGCHSLPSPSRMDGFDLQVVHRPLTPQDVAPHGSAYNMVWGRNHTPEQLQTLANTWGTAFFIVGHQPVETGFEQRGPNQLILASNHEHGVGLPIDLAQPISMPLLLDSIVLLGSIRI